MAAICLGLNVLIIDIDDQYNWGGSGPSRTICLACLPGKPKQIISRKLGDNKWKFKMSYIHLIFEIMLF